MRRSEKSIKRERELEKKKKRKRNRIRTREEDKEDGLCYSWGEVVVKKKNLKVVSSEN
jgi:hypothetical protein